jgi:hypothetical protein
LILLTDSATVLARTCLKDFGARFKRRNFTKLYDKRVSIIAGRPLAHWCRANSLAAAEHNGQEANQGLLRGVVMGALNNASATTLVLGVETPPATKPKRCVHLLIILECLKLSYGCTCVISSWCLAVCKNEQCTTLQSYGKMCILHVHALLWRMAVDDCIEG